MSQAPSNTRRRQRSLRIVAAALLLLVGALEVVGAVVSGSFLVACLSATAAVICGIIAVWLTHSELMITRRDAARDRAEQAQAYRTLAEERAAEAASVRDTLTARIAAGNETIHELEDELSARTKDLAVVRRKVTAYLRRATLADERAATEAARANAESQRANEADQQASEAVVTVAELENQLVDVRAELTAWQQAAAVEDRKHA